MPAPSRDRLARPVDISALYRGAARRVNLIVDEPGLRWTGLSQYPSTTTQTVSGNNSSSPGLRRVGGGGHRVRGQSLRRSVLIGRENRMAVRRGGGRGRGTVLPSWYPRTPLRDITAVVRAIERRRRAQAADAPQEEPDAAAPSTANFQELDVGTSTPLPTIAMKPKSSPATQVWKILEDHEDSSPLTPQKKLLNSIDKVREVWLEEQKKLERTPAAKKVEREKKVRTLMSMR